MSCKRPISRAVTGSAGTLAGINCFVAITRTAAGKDVLNCVPPGAPGDDHGTHKRTPAEVAGVRGGHANTAALLDRVVEHFRGWVEVILAGSAIVMPGEPRGRQLAVIELEPLGVPIAESEIAAPVVPGCAHGIRPVHHILRVTAGLVADHHGLVGLLKGTEGGG